LSYRDRNEREPSILPRGHFNNFNIKLKKNNF